MRILHVVHAYPPAGIGGVEVLTEGLVRSQAAGGHEVAVFARHRDPTRLDYGIHQDGAVTWWNDTGGHRTRFRDLWRNPAATLRLDETVVRFRPDIIHVGHFARIGLDLLGSARVPVVVSVHDFDLGCPRGQRLRTDLGVCETVDRRRCARCVRPHWKELFRAPGRLRTLAALLRGGYGLSLFREYDEEVRSLLDRAAALVFPSASHAGRFATYYDAGPRACIIRNGVPPRDPPRRAEPGGEFRAGFVGALTRSKGSHIAAEAVKRLRGVTLDVFGDGPLRRALVRQGSPILCHGAVPHGEIGRAMDGLHVLLAPSLWHEAFGLSVAEARRDGLPVIASRMGAPAEILKEEEDGLLVPAGDVTALARAVARLRDDRELWRRAARPRPQRTLEEMAGELGDLYARVLAEAHRRPVALD